MASRTLELPITITESEPRELTLCLTEDGARIERMATRADLKQASEAMGAVWPEEDPRPPMPHEPTDGLSTGRRGGW